MSTDLKIIVVGPQSSGKTELSDILSSASKGFQGNRTPTVGIRVLEFNSTLETNGLQANIVVQLWDVSGDDKYLSCWPAISKGADGCLLVYNPQDRKHALELEKYSREFTKNLNSQQCLVIAHKMGTSEEKAIKPKLSKNLENIDIIQCNAKEISDQFNEKIISFLSQVYSIKIKNIEENEKKLIGEIPQQPKSKKIPKTAEVFKGLTDE